MRGHRCSYRIKLTQRLGYVNYWFVEELGSHDQLNGKDSDFKVNSQLAANAAAAGNKDNAVMDLSSGFKFRAANIPRTPKKLAPKSTTPSPDRASAIPNGGSVTTVSDVSNGDIPTNYHYVLGLMPNSSPSRESPLQTVSSAENNSSQSSSQQHSAIDLYSNSSSVEPSNLATVSVTGATAIQQDVASQLFQANFINYMSTMTNLGIGAALQGAINPLLVNVKQEPQDSLQGQLTVNQGQSQLALSQGQGQIALGYPIVTLPSQLQFSASQLQEPSHSLKSHSPSPSGSQGHSPSPSRGQGHGPSPSRGQGFRDRSPLVRDQLQSSGIQKGLELEAKIKSESSRKMQAQQDVLGQVQNRIMERAKCRKSAHTMRIPQKNKAQALNFSKSDAENDIKILSQENLNIPNIFSSTSSAVAGNVAENSSISSIAFQRFQTLNRVLQSDAFQAAKSQLEKKKTVLKTSDKADETVNPLNLIVKQPKSDCSNLSTESHQQYFKLAEEWRKGEQLPADWKKGEQLAAEWSKEDQLSGKETNGDLLLNGHSDILDCKAIIEVDKLTDNEKVMYIKMFSYVLAIM